MQKTTWHAAWQLHLMQMDDVTPNTCHRTQRSGCLWHDQRLRLTIALTLTLHPETDPNPEPLTLTS